MAYTTASRVADYIIFTSGPDGITNLKLQKLIYYCQAWYLGITGSELFPDEIEAWVHGPVVPSVFRTFRKHRWNALPTMLDVPELELGDESRPIREHITEVLSAYGQLSGAQLEALTHAEAPWKNARNGIPPDQPSNVVISPQEMRDWCDSISAA